MAAAAIQQTTRLWTWNKAWWPTWEATMAARAPTTSSGKKTSSGTEDQKAETNMSGCLSHSDYIRLCS